MFSMAVVIQNLNHAVLVKMSLYCMLPIIVRIGVFKEKEINNSLTLHLP